MKRAALVVLPLVVFSVIGVALMHASSDPSEPSAPHKANRLANEKSPYLLQHANNPVDWYPWGEEAFAKAREEDKPIFLSIGYATCHWCHVMERESFEDPEVARLLNDTFVCIKVDREERPDIDQVYMTVCQMLTGGGGWPLTIMMTPDKKPFFAATYIPKASRMGRAGMLDLVPRVKLAWGAQREELVRSSDEIVKHLESAESRGGKGVVEPTVVDSAYQQLASRYDAAHGGFSSAPKFPTAHNLVFLIRYSKRTGTSRALEMAEHTLEAMRRGGVYDHVGFGFHRYSTDREWLVPHFEKMLYDQATLAFAYTEAFRATGKARYEAVAREVFTYVLRDMTAAQGGFYSAEDADSEGEEGKFYVWTVDEVRKVVGDPDAEVVNAVWNLSVEGNFEVEATGRRSGANIPHLTSSRSELAKSLQLQPEELEARLESARQKLFQVREKRVHPLKDDKVLADWNGLMVAALARAGIVFGEPEYVAAASRAADFVLDSMRDADGRLLHRYRDGDVAVAAFLDDYAFLTWALIELYDATLDPRRLAQALQLQDEALAMFWDASAGAFFFTATDAESLLVRQKEIYDGAIPSGNSVAMANLLQLSRLTGRTDLAKRADQLASAFAGELKSLPSAHTHLMTAVQSASSPSVEVVVAGTPGAGDTDRLVAAYRSDYVPNAVLLLVPTGPDGEDIRRLAPFSAAYSPVDDKAAAYVCRDFKCNLPTTDPEELKRLLRGVSAGGKGSAPALPAS